MKTTLFLLVFFLCFGTTAYLQNERPKIGLVLSGGGAKGFAHVGVLKVLEEAEIPIDYIAGTSMGSIIGGLYALGYTPDEMERLIRDVNWDYLLSDHVERQYIPFFEKLSRQRYNISLPVDSVGIGSPAGILKGQYVFNLLSELTIAAHDIDDFSKLPIPFVCVAADITNGKEALLDSGSLPVAIRASMAIPTLFEPVRKDSVLLVDGGIMNNFPVDRVIEMGADIIIGVDLQEDEPAYEEMFALPAILGQMIFMHEKEKHEKNVANCDFYIKPDISGYNLLSFNDQAVDTLLLRGEHAGRALLPRLMRFRDSLGLKPNEITPLTRMSRKAKILFDDVLVHGVEHTRRSAIKGMLLFEESKPATLEQIERGINNIYASGDFHKVYYKIHGEKEGKRKTLHIYVEERSANMFNAGLNYNSEDDASLLLNATFHNKLITGSRLSLDLKLSKNPTIRADFSVDRGIKPGLRAVFEIDQDQIKYFENGAYMVNGKKDAYSLDINAISTLSNIFSFGIGGKPEFIFTRGMVGDGPTGFDEDENFFLSYHTYLRLDNRDDPYYPTKGSNFYTKLKLITDDGFQLRENSGALAFTTRWEWNISLGEKIALQPELYARFISSTNLPVYYKTIMGGECRWDDSDNHLPFVGFRYGEHSVLNAAALRYNIRWNITGDHYLYFKMNTAFTSEGKAFLRKGDWYFGGGLTYSFDSFIGPMELTLFASSLSKKGHSFLSIGNKF